MFDPPGINAFGAHRRCHQNYSRSPMTARTAAIRSMPAAISRRPSSVAALAGVTLSNGAILNALKPAATGGADIGSEPHWRPIQGSSMDVCIGADNGGRRCCKHAAERRPPRRAVRSDNAWSNGTAGERGRITRRCIPIDGGAQVDGVSNNSIRPLTGKRIDGSTSAGTACADVSAASRQPTTPSASSARTNSHSVFGETGTGCAVTPPRAACECFPIRPRACACRASSFPRMPRPHFRSGATPCRRTRLSRCHWQSMMPHLSDDGHRDCEWTPAH